MLDISHLFSEFGQISCTVHFFFKFLVPDVLWLILGSVDVSVNWILIKVLWIKDSVASGVGKLGLNVSN